MNRIEQHETDHECNVCGEESVVDVRGTKRCNNQSCPAGTMRTLSWNSSDEEIEEFKESEEGEFYIERDESVERVVADSFSVEDDGVLVFYENPDVGTLGSKEKTVAYRDWETVEKA